MGNAVTSNISLDHEGDEANNEAIVAGNELRGNVLVVVKQELEPRTVALFFCGSEQAVVESKKKKEIAVRFVFSSFITLQEKGTDKIRPGTYKFPFSVDLPASLPSSTCVKCPEGSKSGCKIEYKIIIDEQVNKDPSPHPRMERVFLVASAPLPDERIPVLVKPCTHTVKALTVIKSGSITFGASIENAHIGREDDLVISLACRNDAAVHVTRVHVKIVEVYHWQVEGQRCSRKGCERILSEKGCDRILIEKKDVSLPGLVKKKSGISRSQFDQSYYKAIRNDLKSHENTIRLTVPQDSRDSYHGHLLEVSHFVEISLLFPGVFDNLTLRVPIRIGAPSIPSARMIYGDEVARSRSRPRRSVTAPFNAEIPIANSILIPDDDAIHMPRSIARGDSMRMGGLPEIVDTDEQFTQLIPFMIPPHDLNPSLEGLLKEMLAAVNDYEIIQTKMGYPRWRNVFSKLSPDEFGSIIAHVNVDSDQPRVAVFIAKNVHGGFYFTCDYVVATLKNSADWNRPTMLSFLLPYCTDILTKSKSIKEELNEWELIVTDADFKEAIRVKSSGIMKE